MRTNYTSNGHICFKRTGLHAFSRRKLRLGYGTEISVAQSHDTKGAGRNEGLQPLPRIDGFESVALAIEVAAHSQVGGWTVRRRGIETVNICSGDAVSASQP